PLRGHADAHAADHVLGERSVLHAIGAEALIESLRGTKHAAALAYVLAEHNHARVVRELPRLRHCNGFDHRDFRHGYLRFSVAKRRLSPIRKQLLERMRAAMGRPKARIFPSMCMCDASTCAMVTWGPPVEAFPWLPPAGT